MSLITQYFLKLILSIMTGMTSIISVSNATDPSAFVQHNFTQQPERSSIAPSRQPVSSNANEIIQKSYDALKYLESYWRDLFIKNKQVFRSPRVFITREGSAFYTPQEHRIYLSLPFLAQLTQEVIEKIHTDGDLAYIAVLAHEYGHSIQQMMRVKSTSTIKHELQADCLSGAFIGHLEQLGVLEHGDLDEATAMFLFARDPTGTDPNHENAHGTGAQRVISFLSGVTDGISVCQCGLK